MNNEARRSRVKIVYLRDVFFDDNKTDVARLLKMFLTLFIFGFVMSFCSLLLAVLFLFFDKKKKGNRQLNNLAFNYMVQFLKKPSAEE